MRRVLIAFILAIACASAQAQRPSPVDWSTVSRFMSLMQLFMQTAAANAGDDPRAAQRAMDEILAGRNREANRLMLEIFGDIPYSEREKLLAIGRSMVVLGQKQFSASSLSAAEAAIVAARRELVAMGLTYHDRNQFLDAVKRGDVLAVKLYLAGRGVDPDLPDASGNSALDYARRAGNPELIALLDTKPRRP